MQRSVTTKGVIFILIAISGISCNILNPQSNRTPAPVSNTYEYWLTGGFAGSRYHTIIDSTGLAQYTTQFSGSSGITTYSYRLTADEFDTIATAFEQADFYSLDSIYVAAQPIVDGFDLSVTWHADNRSKTVAVRANASVPVGLSNLLRALNNLDMVIQSKGQKS